MTGVARIGEHFATADLLNSFARGFPGEDRVRALIHFDGDCPVCGEAFAGLADRAQQWENPTSTRQHRDFVARALQRWHDERQGAEPVVDLTPIHHEWLGRARRESGIFCRLAIEEARLMALEDQGCGYSVLTAALEVVSDPRLSRVGHGRWQLLRALTTVYAARSWRGGGGGLRHPMRTAEKQLEQGKLDYELCAAVYLSGFWLALRSLIFDEAELYLGLAGTFLERFLEARPSPGHLAQLRVTQAIDVLRADRYEEGRERFTEALSQVPERCVRMRILVHGRLAALSSRLDDPGGLRRHQREAERLAALHGLKVGRPKSGDLERY